MTTTTDFDRLVASWLANDGPSDVAPGLVDAAVAESARLRQRAGLSARIAGVRPWPAGRLAGRSWGTSGTLRLVGLLALLIALLAGALLVAGRLIDRPVRLAGVLEPIGRLDAPLVQARALRIRDGTVLVVGTDPTTRRWHAELFDPAEAAFEPIDATALGPADGYPMSLVELADGDVLLTQQRSSTRDGETGGGLATRFDPDSQRFDEVGPSSELAGSEAEWFGFARFPVERLQDGRVRWVAPAIEVTHDVVYDPDLDRFAMATEAGGVVGRRPLDGGPVVGLADGRILDLETGDWGDDDDPLGAVAPRIVDPAGASADVGLDWPGYVRGGAYAATLLHDGRVLIVGASGALFDPATLTFVDLPAPPQGFAEVYGSRAFRDALILPDRRILLWADSPSSDSTAWVFDPGPDTLARADSAEVTGGVAAQALLDDGRVLVVGGQRSEADPRPSDVWVLR